MNLFGVTGANTESYDDKDVAPAARTAAGDVLGKDDFLKLLVTQLTYQDPLDPVGDQEFIAQLAQFSALEQMQNVSKGIERLTEMQAWIGGLSQAASLIGRSVVVTDVETGESVEGVVSAARIAEGVPIVVVDGEEHSLWAVTEVLG